MPANENPWDSVGTELGKLLREGFVRPEVDGCAKRNPEPREGAVLVAQLVGGIFACPTDYARRKAEELSGKRPPLRWETGLAQHGPGSLLYMADSPFNSPVIGRCIRDAGGVTPVEFLGCLHQLLRSIGIERMDLAVRAGEVSHGFTRVRSGSLTRGNA